MVRVNSQGEQVTLTREEVLDVAKEAFAKNGYRGTNLGDVANTLGVTRQALYYYFPKKHSILTALFGDFFDRLERSVTEAAGAHDDSAARFQAMLRAYVQTVVSSPAHSSIFMRDDINLTADERDKIMQRRRRLNDLFVDVYREAVVEGRFDDVPPQVAVALILGAANWTFRWFRPTGELTPVMLADLTSTLLANGYRAGERASSNGQGRVI